MPTESNLLGEYLQSRYTMNPDQVSGHTEFVKRRLGQLAKPYSNQKFKRETVIAVAFSPEPIQRGRHIDPLIDYKTILEPKTGYTLAQDKKLFPNIFDNEFVFGIKTNKRVLISRIYPRYKWNNADIIGIIQILVLCSKDDRRVILGSGLHDFLLEYKIELYNEFKKQSEDLTVDDFRWITSDAFRWIINSEGMGPIKSKVMSNVLDCFQKHAQKRKWEIPEL